MKVIRNRKRLNEQGRKQGKSCLVSDGSEKVLWMDAPTDGSTERRTDKFSCHVTFSTSERFLYINCNTMKKRICGSVDKWLAEYVVTYFYNAQVPVQQTVNDIGLKIEIKIMQIS